jgi:hypothetical protein
MISGTVFPAFLSFLTALPGAREWVAFIAGPAPEMSDRDPRVNGVWLNRICLPCVLASTCVSDLISSMVRTAIRARAGEWTAIYRPAKVLNSSENAHKKA